jgi:opacity protein-like surface antigen
MFAKLIVAFSVLFCAAMLQAEAQSFYKRSYTSQVTLSAGTGTASYFGDLIDDGKFNFRPSISAGARYAFRDRFSVASDLTYFRLAGDDANSAVKERRNLSFKSNNVELNATLRFSLFRPKARFYLREPVNPYFYGGIGLLWFQPKTEYEGETYNLRPLETEGVSYSPFTVAFPLGAGVKFKMNAFVDITIDGGYRFVLSDYLDDVSGEYPDPASFTDPLARALSDRSGEIGTDPPMAQRGLPPFEDFKRWPRGWKEQKDGYFILNVRVEYYLSPIRDTYRALRYRGTRQRMNRRR